MANCHLKIADFGLAKLLDAQGQTASNAIVGTPSYMAPEQASGQSKRIGPATDVYALGAILYELLTGRPPFKAAEKLETILQVMSDEPLPPSRLQPRTPVDLETVCLKCLEKEPGKRYASARALADDLGRYLRGEPVAARPLSRLKRAWRWCRRNPVVAALTAGVVAALVLGVLFSTYFAVDASWQAVQARGNEARAKQNEATAKQERADAVRARNDLAKTNDQLMTTVVRGVLRPLALDRRPLLGLWPTPMTPPEVEALWELASYRGTPLGVRFVEEATRNLATTQQMRTRAEYALHAAVGLDEPKRQDVEGVLRARLEVNRLAETERTDLELTAAALGGSSPATHVRLVAALTRAISKTTDGIESRDLARSLTAVAARLGPREAALAAASLTQAMSGATSPFELGTLAEELAARLARENPSRSRQRIGVVVGSVGLLADPGSLLLASGLLCRAVEPLPPPLPAQVLVDLLKHPLCVGQARRLVLDQLQRHYNRPFADQWDFVRFAHKSKLPLDLTSPPERPEPVAAVHPRG